MTISRLTWLAIAVLLVSTTAIAAPLQNESKLLLQPNGDTVHCFASGDEFYHRMHDENGYTIVQSPTSGYWVYAIPAIGRAIAASDYIVDHTDPVTLGLEPNLVISKEEYLSLREARLGPDGYTAAAPTTGIIRHLVIFVRFAGEDEFTALTDVYNRRLNWAHPDTNSLYNYYVQDSYDQLELLSHFYPVSSTDTIMSYEDSLSRDYFQPYHPTTNPNGYDTTGGQLDSLCAREQNLVRRAVTAIRSEVDPALVIDADGDGRVDNVSFIIKGFREDWGDLLWPHRWWMMCDTVTINGLDVYDYAFTFDGNYSVSTQCHETAHVMGFPDLYHYSSSSLYDPIGSWGLMESNTNPPQHHLMHMKYKYGEWLTPSQIPLFYRGTKYLQLNKNMPSSTSPTAYRLGTNPLLAGDEYLVAELRKREGLFDGRIPGSGLILSRINPNIRGNASGPPDEVYIFRPGGCPTCNGNLNIANLGAHVGRFYASRLSDPYLFLTDDSDPQFLLYDIGPIEGDSIELSFSFQYYTAPSTLSGTWNKYSSTSDNLYWVSDDAIRHAVSTFTIENGARVYGEPGKKIFCDGGSFEVTAGADWTRIYTLNGYKSGIKSKGQIKVYNLGTIKFR